MIIECPRCQSRYDSSLKRPGAPIPCRCGQIFYTPRLPNLAKASNCPNCGGAASPDQNQCDYCGVYLAFARCPACFSIAPYQGAKFCAECGDSLLQPAKMATESNRKFPCPRCTTDKHKVIPLERKKIGTHTIDSCSQCSGVWLDHTILDKLLAQGNAQKSSQAVLGKSPARVHDLPRHKVRYLSCPECEQLMNRRNFARKSGIIVDECSAHGIWFDRQELAAAIQFVRASPEAVEHRFETPAEIRIQAAQARHKTEPADRNKPFEITGGDLLDLFAEFPSFFS